MVLIRLSSTRNLDSIPHSVWTVYNVMPCRRVHVLLTCCITVGTNVLGPADTYYLCSCINVTVQLSESVIDGLIGLVSSVLPGILTNHARQVVPLFGLPRLSWQLERSHSQSWQQLHLVFAHRPATSKQLALF